MEKDIRKRAAALYEKEKHFGAIKANQMACGYCIGAEDQQDIDVQIIKEWFAYNLPFTIGQCNRDELYEDLRKKIMVR